MQVSVVRSRRLRSSTLGWLVAGLAMALPALPARADDAPAPPSAPMAEPAAEMAPPAPATPPPAAVEPAAPAATEVPAPARSPDAAAPVLAEPAASLAPAPAPAPAEVAPSPAPAHAEVVEAGDAVEAVEAVEVTKEDSKWDLAQIVQVERAVNVQFAQTTRRHAFLLIVDHRTFQAAFNKNSWGDFFGLDSGNLRIGIGLRFGILDGLDVGVYRLNNATDAFDTYEFDVKWRFLRADKHYIDMAIRAGLSWFSQKNAKDAVGGFGQLLISRMLFRRLTLGTGLMFHSDSSSDVKSNLDTQWSLAVPGSVEIRILPWLAWNVEATFKVAGYGAKWPSFSTAWKFLSPKHVFSLVLSNTQYIGADGIVANSRRGYKDLIIGFQIQREFPLPH